MFFGKKRKDSLLNGVEDKDRNFKYVKNSINEKNLKQRIRYTFAKHETIDQLENVFKFDIETHDDQEFAEAYEASLFDVNGSREKWDRDLTSDEIVVEK